MKSYGDGIVYGYPYTIYARLERDRKGYTTHMYCSMLQIDTGDTIEKRFEGFKGIEVNIIACVSWLSRNHPRVAYSTAIHLL